MLDHNILREHILSCVPTETAKAEALNCFKEFLLNDLITFLYKEGLEMFPSDFHDIETDSIIYRDFNIWKRNLRFHVLDVNREIELFLDDVGNWCCLDPEINENVYPIKVITESQLMEYIWEKTPNPERDDTFMCLGMAGILLEDTLVEWKKIEEEFKKSPELFEDITAYDEDGKAFIMNSYGEKLFMPSEGYNCLDTIGEGEWTRTSLCNSFVYIADDYIDLLDDKIYVLLDAKKFVRKLD